MVFNAYLHQRRFPRSADFLPGSVLLTLTDNHHLLYLSILHPNFSTTINPYVKTLIVTHDAVIARFTYQFQHDTVTIYYGFIRSKYYV